MNKRSAVFVASGLVVAMVAAAFGIMMGFTGPSSAGGKVQLRPRHSKPVVKTVTDRKTIHVPAPGGGTSDGTTTVVMTDTPAPSTDATTQDDTSGDSSQAPEPTHAPEPSDTETPEPSDTHSESQSPEPGDD